MELLRLLENLIGNAIKYRANRPPEIAIGAQQHSCEWIFSVSDNGIGITPKDQKRIFRMFERLGLEEAPQGSGMGLAICERIIQQHGGRIWVESNPGAGSTFFFTIPANEATPQAR